MPVIICKNNFQNVLYSLYTLARLCETFLDSKEVLYCDNNKMSLDGSRFIRNAILNKKVYNCCVIKYHLFSNYITWSSAPVKLLLRPQQEMICTLYLVFNGETMPAAVASAVLMAAQCGCICCIMQSFLHLSCD